MPALANIYLRIFTAKISTDLPLGTLITYSSKFSDLEKYIWYIYYVTPSEAFKEAFHDQTTLTFLQENL